MTVICGMILQGANLSMLQRPAQHHLCWGAVDLMRCFDNSWMSQHWIAVIPFRKPLAPQGAVALHRTHTTLKRPVH